MGLGSLRRRKAQIAARKTATSLSGVTVEVAVAVEPAESLSVPEQDVEAADAAPSLPDAIADASNDLSEGAVLAGGDAATGRRRGRRKRGA